MNISFLDQEPLLGKVKSILFIAVLVAAGVLIVDQAISFFTPEQERIEIEFLP